MSQNVHYDHSAIYKLNEKHSNLVAGITAWEVFIGFEFNIEKRISSRRNEILNTK